MTRAKILKSGLLLGVLLGTLYVIIQWLSPTSERLFTDYSARLNRVLDISIEPPQAQAALPTISWRDFHREEPELNLSLLDSISLRNCNLDQLVFEANSSLGKVASADYRLIWHSQITQGLEQCLNKGQLRPSLNAKLQNILQRKSTHLPSYWYNFLSSEDAIQRLWQGNTRLNDSPLPAYRQVAEQLEQLLAIGQRFTQSQSIDAAQLLRITEQLSKAPTLNALAQELNNASQWLNSISRALEDRQYSCRQQAKQFTILQNILNKVYMPRVQTYLAQLDQSITLLTPPITALFNGQDWNKLVIFIKQVQREFHQANRRHVKQWQVILNSCSGTAS